MKRILLGISIFLFCACSPKGPTQEEYNGLKQENEKLTTEIETLKKELEGYKNSPEKLIAKAKSYYESNNLSELKNINSLLQKYHPESKENTEVKEWAIILEKKIKSEQEKAEKERIAKLEKEKAERLKAVNKLKKNHDDISGTTWYKNPYFTHYNESNRTSIYIGKNGSSVWLRLKMSYEGDGWIFFEKAYLSYDGNTLDIPFNKYDDKKSDHYTNCWEWIDILVTPKKLNFLKEMVDGKNPKMRLSGKYTQTRNLSSNEIKGIKDVLLAYDVLLSEK